jgi:Domain of unknown function (DUF4157)
MKPSIYRRMRRSASHEATNANKESKQEQSFFGESSLETFFQPSPVIQRKCEKCEEEDKKVQRQPEKKEEEKKVMRVEDKKEEEKLQKKEGKKEEEKIQKKDNGSAASTGTTASNYISSISSKGNPLPANANHFFSSRMGYDFSNVKIHTDKEAAESAKDVNAKAYTVGNHIVFNEGQFNTESSEGKKLMAHELVHVMQQQEMQQLSRKGEKDTKEECTAGSVDLEAETNATYKKGAGTAKNEVTKKSKNCDGCEDDSCVTITGSLKVPYSVATTVNLPTVPSNLTECQQDRVRTAINTTLSAHEQKHVRAFETFNGTASLPINYQGCSDGYVSYQEGLADAEFERRKTAADAKSAALDPFSVNVDLCCKDKPKK